MRSEYLIVLLLTVIVPALFAADRRLRLYREWKRLAKAVLLPSALFIAWDALAVARGHWWFNPKYTVGLHIGNLPIEEYLFHLVIGFVAVYTYEVVRYFRGERT